MGEVISRFHYEEEELSTQTKNDMGLSLRNSNNNAKLHNATSKPHDDHKADTHAKESSANLPPFPWPQAPLLMRASSNTTRVLRVRPAYDDDATLQSRAQSDGALPVNNGDEANPLAVDFESDLFRGTIMVRVKGAAVADDADETTTQTNYFTGKQRQFQVVISGQFLRPNLPMSEILSGQILEQPLGKLPGMPIVSGILKLYKTLQPKLNVEFANPSSPYAVALSPLAALAQTVLVGDAKQQPYLPTDQDLQEPHPSDAQSLFPDADQKKNLSVNQRRHRRKQMVDDEACFDMNKTYTFDMYQHQLHLCDYTLQVAPLYRLSIAPVLNGQPLRILCVTASHETLWSFELWHECLL